MCNFLPKSMQVSEKLQKGVRLSAATSNGTFTQEIITREEAAMVKEVPEGPMDGVGTQQDEVNPRIKIRGQQSLSTDISLPLSCLNPVGLMSLHPKSLA